MTTNETITVKSSREPYEAKGMPSLCCDWVSDFFFQNGFIPRGVLPDYPGATGLTSWKNGSDGRALDDALPMIGKRGRSRNNRLSNGRLL